MICTPSRMASMGWRRGYCLPFRCTCPLSGASTPPMTLMRVDLPDPFSPARQWISPGWIVMLTSSRACTPAKALLTFRISRSGCWVMVSGTVQGGGSAAPTKDHRTSGVSLEGVLVHVLYVDDDPCLAVDDLAVDLDVVVAVNFEVHPGRDLLVLEY